MSYIEDTRKLMQDFLAPELRAISVRLDALEELVKANEARTQQRFSDASQQVQDVETRTQQRFSEFSQQLQDTETRTQQRFSEFSQQLQDTEARTQQRFSDIDRRFSEVERRAEQRHSETLNAISNLSSYQAVLERLARLESKQNVSAA